MSEKDLMLGLFFLGVNIAMIIFPILWWIQVNNEMKRLTRND